MDIWSQWQRALRSGEPETMVPFNVDHTGGGTVGRVWIPCSWVIRLMPDGFRLLTMTNACQLSSWDRLRPEKERDMIRCYTGCNKASGVGFDGGMGR